MREICRGRAQPGEDEGKFILGTINKGDMKEGGNRQYRDTDGVAVGENTHPAFYCSPAHPHTYVLT